MTGNAKTASSRTTDYHGLRVAVLAAHGEVEAERVAVDDVHVARLGAAEGVDAAAERPVRADVDHDLGVLAVDRHCGVRVVLVSNLEEQLQHHN